MLTLLTTFFLVGVGSEYTYAKWTQDLVENKKISVLWAGLWGLFNVYFLLELASKQDFIVGGAWIVGVMFGTLISLKRTEQQNIEILTPLVWKKPYVCKDYFDLIDEDLAKQTEDYVTKFKIGKAPKKRGKRKVQRARIRKRVAQRNNNYWDERQAVPR